MVKQTAGTRQVLTNPRHEAYAQALAMGRTATEAYVEAGYRESRAAACRLAKTSPIAKRVEELQCLGAERVFVSIESLTDELEAARLQAMASGRYAAAVSAVLGKAKLHNLLKAESISAQTSGLFTFDGSMLDDLTDDEMDLLERVALRIGLMVDTRQPKPGKLN